ncbi:MAG: hypothetical protein KF680_10060 [Cryobacterium sp.]|nr:hypothetical protein [Cryobacterium sp.]
MEILPALLWFAAAYLLIALISMAHVVYNVKVKQLTDRAEGASILHLEAYRETLRWQPLFALGVFSIVSYIYFGTVLIAEVWPAAVALGLTWVAMTAIVDLIARVVLRHPWSLTVRELFVEQQPWQGLAYAAIVAAPLLAAPLVVTPVA